MIMLMVNQEASTANCDKLPPVGPGSIFAPVIANDGPTQSDDLPALGFVGEMGPQRPYLSLDEIQVSDERG